jgi:hypothetical protein
MIFLEQEAEDVLVLEVGESEVGAEVAINRVEVVEAEEEAETGVETVAGEAVAVTAVLVEAEAADQIVHVAAIAVIEEVRSAIQSTFSRFLLSIYQYIYVITLQASLLHHQYRRLLPQSPLRFLPRTTRRRNHLPCSSLWSILHLIPRKSLLRSRIVLGMISVRRRCLRTILR